MVCRFLNRIAGLAAVCLPVLAGCRGVDSVAQRPSPYPLLSAVPALEPAGCKDGAALEPTLPVEGPVSFGAFVDVALRHHPDLRIAEAQVEAAQGKFLQAGLYPNPTVGWQASDLGAKANAAGKQGPAVTQNIVTAGKLELAQAAAAHAVASADWQAVTHWYDVMAKLRGAYYDALAAQREVQVNAELVRIAEDSLKTAEKFEKAGASNRPDVLRAQVERDQARNRLEVAERRVEASWRLLTNAAGMGDTPIRQLAGSLADASPEYDYAAIRDLALHSNSEIEAARAAVAEAEVSVRKAEADVIPDVQLFAQPEYMFDEKTMGAQAGISVVLPIFNKNQGNIKTAQAELAKSQALLRQTELKLTAEIATAFQRWQAARLQAKNYQDKIVPNAVESLRLISLAYEHGDPKFDYTAVLQAQSILAQARLTAVEASAELQRAVSDLEALLQRDAGAFFRQR